MANESTGLVGRKGHAAVSVEGDAKLARRAA